MAASIMACTSAIVANLRAGSFPWQLSMAAFCGSVALVTGACTASMIASPRTFHRWGGEGAISRPQCPIKHIYAI